MVAEVAAEVRMYVYMYVGMYVGRRFPSGKELKNVLCLLLLLLSSITLDLHTSSFSSSYLGYINTAGTITPGSGIDGGGNGGANGGNGAAGIHGGGGGGGAYGACGGAGSNGVVYIRYTPV